MRVDFGVGVGDEFGGTTLDLDDDGGSFMADG
jgi:hypothetical protein